jgi:hypothetical protein
VETTREKSSAGVVDDDVHRPESLHRALDQVPGGGRLAHVAVDQEQVAFGCQCSGAGDIARVGYHVETRIEKASSQAEANAAGSACDHCCLLVFAVHVLYRWTCVRKRSGIPACALQNRVTVW